MNRPALLTTYASFVLSVLAIVLSVLVVVSANAATDGAADNRDAELLTARDNPAVVKRGKKIYRDLCQSCHGDEKVTGDAVSNLFDAKWYHGGRPAEIEHSTLNGFPEKGMPVWKDALPLEDTTAVTAYLLTFQKR
jgi:cytochrome c oxidase cbb3-type subunit 3